MINKKVSVVSTCYNHDAYLRSWYSGLQDQVTGLKTIGYDLEVVVVVDASPDDSLGELLTYSWKDIDLKLYYNNVNQEGPTSLTTGISLATGDFIALLDCDDFYKEGKLVSSVKHLEDNPHLAATSHEISAILKDGSWVERGWANISRVPPAEITIDSLRHAHCIYTCTTLYRAEILRSCPSPFEFSHRFGFLGDYPTNSYVCKHFGPMGYQNMPLSVHRDSVGINSNREESIRLDGLVREWIARGCLRNELI